LAAYDFLFTSNSYHNSICLRFRDIYDKKYLRSRPFRPLRWS